MTNQMIYNKTNETCNLIKVEDWEKPNEFLFTEINKRQATEKEQNPKVF